MDGLRDLLGDCKLGQSDWQADRSAEAVSLLQFVLRRIFQHQLRQAAERDLFAVHHTLALRDRVQAVTDSMGCALAAALKSDAAEQGVCLDDIFDRLRAELTLNRLLGLAAVSQKHVIAQPRDRLGGQRGFAAVDIVRGRCRTCTRFEVGGECVAHTGHQQPDRRMGDQLRVNEHDIRALGQRQPAVKRAVIMVDHGQGRAGGIRGDRRRDNHAGRVKKTSGRLRRIHDFAAAGADYNITALVGKDTLHAVDLGHRAFALKSDKVQGTGRTVGPLHGRLDAFHAECAGDDQRLFAKAGDMPAQVAQFSASLDIFARCSKDDRHRRPSNNR